MNGTVNLILCDGAVLNIPKGITVNGEYGGSLTVWAQKNGTGALNVDGTEYGNAGIGGIGGGGSGSTECGGGSLTVNGGVISVAGGSQGGSAIGTGQIASAADPFTITVNGGRDLGVRSGRQRVQAPPFERMTE